ncbi:MAG TPA: 3'-5' exonuclease, partial [Bacillota bacterium]|nr:3'-5' exonuclease [Bacillota bacterium]
AIDRYFSFLEGVILPSQDMTTEDGLILAKHDDMKLRYDDLKHMPLDQRVKIMHRWLQTQSKRRAVKAKAEIQDFYERRLEIVRSHFPVHLQHMPNPKAIQLLQERDDACKHLQEQVTTAVKQYRQQMPKQLSLLNLYQELMGNEDNLEKFWPELAAELRNAMVYHHNRSVSRLDQEDLALLLRLKEHLYGLKDQYIHVVIDEAQDLNLAEFFMIRRLLGDTTSMTIVGDLAQGIYPQRGLTDWSSLMDDIIHDKQIVYREMKRSYRSSAEIIDLANTLLRQENTTAAEAVRHTGDLPVLRGFETGSKVWQQKAAAVLAQIGIWQQNADLNTFAILCKGTQNCQKLFHALQAILPGEVELITEETDQYQSKIVVLPVFLAKGLEFDACFVADAEDTVYSNSKADRHLLYVALTRPLHRLAVYYSGKITECLNDLHPSLYQT